tara:strand:+ start:48174 stop:48818 length:645 start_codon:yes stop_codon:yes gene_type:complete
MDPYAVQPHRAYVDGDVSVRPTGLTVIAVISLLAGIVGLLSGFFGVAGLFLGEMFANVVQPAGPGQDLQQAMQKDINAVTQKYFWVTLPLLLAGMVVSGLMATGGIGILASKCWSRVLLRRVLMVAIIVECLKAVTQFLSQLEMGPIMREHMGKIANSGNSPGGEAMGQMIQVMTYFGIAFMAVWTIMKIALMIWARVYLNRPATKEFFDKVAN